MDTVRPENDTSEKGTNGYAVEIIFENIMNPDLVGVLGGGEY